MSVAVGLNVQEREEAASSGIAAADVGVVGAVFRSERGPVGVPLRLDSLGDVVSRFGHANIKFNAFFCLRGLFTNAGETGATVYGTRVVPGGFAAAQPARVDSLGPPTIPPHFVPPLAQDGTVTGSDPSYHLLVDIGDPLNFTLRAVDDNATDTLTISVAVLGGTLTPAEMGFVTTFPHVDPAPGGSTHLLTLTGTALDVGTVLLEATVVDGQGGMDVISVLVEVKASPFAWATASLEGTAVFGEGESPGVNRQGETFLVSGAAPNLATVVFNNDGSLSHAALVSSADESNGAVAAFPDGTAALVGDFVSAVLFPASPSGTISKVTAVPGDRAAFYARVGLDRRFDWVRILDPGGGYTRAWSAAVLGDGSFLMAGMFSGTVSFPTAGAPIVLVSAGAAAYFLARVAGVGGLALWAVQSPFGGLDPAAGTFPPVVAALSAGGSVLGWTERTATAPIGNPRARATGRDAAGATLWDFVVSHTESPYRGSEVQSAGVYADGSAVLAGTLYAGAYSFPTTGAPVVVTAIGRSDGFVAKLNTSGEMVWVKQMGSAGESARATAVSPLADGGAIAALTFQGSLSLDTGAGSIALTAPGSSESAAVVRFTSAGLVTWAKLISGP